MSGARPLFYWCHASARDRYETGVQRVTRRLAPALAASGCDVIPIGYDERRRAVEMIGQGSESFATCLGSSDTRPIMFIPDITADFVACGADPVLLARAYGMRPVIMAHDLIPIKLSKYYPDETVRIYKAYYSSMASADRVIATTRMVAGELRAFLDDEALPAPPIRVVPLPAQMGRQARRFTEKPPRSVDATLKLVAVGSWEPRKNLLRLLRALDVARRAVPAPIILTLIGRRGLFSEFDRELEAVLAKSVDVIVAGALPDAAAADKIAACDASIYPSWEEGFGLPIGESLWLGTPCLCHDGSAMAEVAPGGGTLMIDMRDSDAIAEALVAFATRSDLLAALADEARRRPLRSWDQYAVAMCSAIFDSA